MTRVRPTETQFLDELETLFLERGYRALTIAEIARVLRCSRRKLYQIAPTKEALFLYAIERNLRRLRAASWTEAGKHTENGQKIEAYLKVGQIYARRSSPIFLEDLAALPEGRALFDAHLRDCVESLSAIIESGIAAGEFAAFNAPIVAEILFTAARTLRDPAILRGAGMSFDRAVEELNRLVTRGLLPRTASAGTRMLTPVSA